MLFGPPLAALSERLIKRLYREAEHAPDDFSDARGSVLIIGFGRFGQVVSQCFLAQHVDVTIIDNDVEMIQSACRFGFKIYYGDGTRLDVLRAAGAGRARLIAVCVDKSEVANKIVDLVKSQFSYAKLFVRSYDRRHTLDLIAKGVDYEIRETLESAVGFGTAALAAIGVDAATVDSVIEDIRTRDKETASHCRSPAALLPASTCCTVRGCSLSRSPARAAPRARSTRMPRKSSRARANIRGDYPRRGAVSTIALPASTNTTPSAAASVH